MSEEKLSTRDIAGTRAPDEGDRAVGREVVAAQPARDAAADVATAPPLFAFEESQGYRARWDAVQTGFVDEPRRAVEEADSLVADVMKRLAEVFADERRTMEQQWDKGDQVSTEDLRQALRRYRTFFHRLLDI
jgi:hypothetical protein